jgi:uncharacterized cupredoxin-like copper-binding protein
MKNGISKLTTALTLLAMASSVAHAHGTERHDTATAPVIKEQTAWGIAGDPAQTSRTLEIVMTDDMRFTPDAVTVREGETLRLVVRNAGSIMHELVIGDEAALKEHADLMLKFPDMVHDEPYMVHVPPGESAELVWTFNRAGRFEFACLIAGHYQAGMLASVEVERVDFRAEFADPTPHQRAGAAH